MANEKNLRPFTSDQSHEEAVKNGKNGGIASGEARRAKKNLREAMQILMEADLTDKSGKTMTGTEAMAARAFQAALKGDWKAWELVRDTSGQKPVEKVMVADVEPSIIAEVEAMVNDERDGCQFSVEKSV